MRFIHLIFPALSWAMAAVVAAPGVAVAAGEEQLFRDLETMEQDAAPAATPEADRVPPPAAPASNAAADPVPAAEGRPKLDHPPYDLVVGIDLFPFGGTSTVTRGHDVRRLSLGLFGTYTGSVRGLEASAGANVVSRGVDGFQAAGAGNLVLGDVDGFQAAGGVNLLLGGLDGFQAAGGVNVVVGDVDGFQGSGGVNVTLGTVSGVQLAGGVNVAGKVAKGSQIAGGVNVATGDVEGVQVAPVNIAANADAAIGVFSLMYKGRWAIDAWSGDTGLSSVALVNGARYTHTMLFAGVQPLGRRMVAATGLGLGGHLPVTGSLSFDVDVLGAGLHRELEEGGFDGRDVDGFLGTMRAVVRWRPFRGLGFFAGPSGNVLVSESLDADRFAMAPVRRLREQRNDGSSRDVNVWVWPGFQAGVRLYLH